METSRSAKSRLSEACTSKHWNQPTFVLCGEEGPSHKKMFTCKVTVEVETISSTILECYSLPLPQKKKAQEHAAEGALWYLKHLGYLS